MDTNQAIKNAYIDLGLDEGASIKEIRAKYLDKTSHSKFQRILTSDDAIGNEFIKFYKAYVTLGKAYSDTDFTSDMEFYPPDQVYQFHYNQGVYLFINQQYIKAGEKFQEAYKINRKNAPVLIYLGVLLIKRKNFYAAEKYLKDAVEIDQNNDDAWFYLGESYLKAGEYRKAINAFETAKSINPGRQEVAFMIRDIKQLIEEKLKGKKKDSFISRIIKKLSGE
jgi:tetratricopeptide (TPR) repeat protein